MIIIIAAAVGTFIIVFLLVACYLFKRRKKKDSHSSRGGERGDYSLMHRASSTDDLVYGNPRRSDLEDSTSDSLDDTANVSGAGSSQHDTNDLVKPPTFWTTGQLIPPSVRMVDVTLELGKPVQNLLDTFFVDDPSSSASPFRFFQDDAQEVPVVLRVKRVENTSLWRKYSLTRDIICAKGPYLHVSTSVNTKDPGRKLAAMLMDNEDDEDRQSLLNEGGIQNDSLNEVILFHGTSPKYVQHIRNQGYDSRVSTTSGNFGAGCYFTDDFRKSHQYAKCDRENKFYLFINRVLLGTTFTSYQAMKRLRRPPQDVVSGQLCDSVVGTIKTYKEYVVYDNAQCYPDLLVIYTMKPKRTESDEV